jgi:type VI secretion system secreted protein Hcp
MQTVALKKALAALIGVAAIVTAYVLLSGDTSKGTFPVAGAASVDYFLKIDGIDGESTDDKHKNEIEILSYSWGLSQAGAQSAGGGGGAGKATFKEFTFKKTIDKTSPLLMKACASGQHIKEAIMQVRKAGASEDYYEIRLTDVLCSSLMQNGESGQLPMEQISFNYEKIEFKYMAQDRDGTTVPVTAGWDLAKNKGI